MQTARPSVDYSNVDWFSNLGIGENFYTTIDDTSPDDDSSYVYGEYQVLQTVENGCYDIASSSAYSFKLSSLSTPYNRSGHKLRIRIYGYLYSQTGSPSCSPSITCRITQGVPSESNTIFSDTIQYSLGSWNTYEYTLTSTEANQITDYSNLYVEFYSEATGTVGGTITASQKVHLRVTQVEFQIPDTSTTVTGNFPLLIIGGISVSGCSTTYGDVTSTNWQFPQYLDFTNATGTFSFSSGNICQATSTGAWRNIELANGDFDESYSYKLLDEFTSDSSNVLQFRNYQFSGTIPSGAQIVGVQAKLYKTRWMEFGGTPDDCRDTIIKLNYGHGGSLSCGSCSSGLPNTWTIDSTWSNGSCSQCTGISGPQTLQYVSGCVWQTTGTITCGGNTLPKWKLEYNGSWGLTAGNATTYTLPIGSGFNCTGNNLFEKNTDLLNCTEPTGVSLVYGSGTPSFSGSCGTCSYINLIGNNKSGAWASGSSTDPWPFGETGEFIYGSSGDTWGYTLTEDVVKDCTFGVSVLGEKDTGVFQSGITLGLDAALLRVWYRPATTTCPTFPMYISGSTSGADGFFPMYTSGSTPSGNFPLFIEGNQPHSGTFPLFTSGNYDQSSGSFPLFTEAAATQTGSINLYLHNNSGEGLSGSIPLFILGSTYSGIQDTFPLYTSGSNRVSGSINLYINSDGSNPSGSINLYTYGAYDIASESVPLFVEALGATGSIPLFTLGSGLLNNGYPASGSINLYLHRPSSAENSIPLFINANAGSGGFPLCITGIGSASGGFPMVIPSAVGSPTGSIPLYTHGF